MLLSHAALCAGFPENDQICPSTPFKLSRYNFYFTAQLLYLSNRTHCVCIYEPLGHRAATWRKVSPCRIDCCPAYSFCLLSTTLTTSHWLRNQYNPPERKDQREVLPFLPPYLCRAGNRWQDNLLLPGGYEGWFGSQSEKKTRGLIIRAALPGRRSTVSVPATTAASPPKSKAVDEIFPLQQLIKLTVQL